MESIGSPTLWFGFLAFVGLMLALDLGVFHRKAHVVSAREALVWSLVWVGLALLFNLGMFLLHGRERGVEFLTGYLIEKSLSVDNIFVFVVVFSALGIPALHQHRVLFWGILSALAMRAAMILGGAALLERFHWLVYLFGAFLVLTGVKMLWRRSEGAPGARLLRLLRRVLPTSEGLDGGRFFTRVAGRRLATPLFLALVLVELVDVVFAVDSIPAIFAVTRDPFIVFTSNIFAILGLRSLYFLLAGLVHRFRYLKVGLGAVLVFVGLKMALVEVVKIPPLVSLAVVALILGAAVAWSLRRPCPPAGCGPA
jgi:tellurite resistance protein TerC